jgi:hypothetical protein
MPFSRRGRPGVMGMMARTAVVAGTARATTNAMDRRSNERAMAQQQQLAQPSANAAPAVASAGGGDLVSQLTDLAKLRDAGVLNAEEFGAAKAKLLAAT